MNTPQYIFIHHTASLSQGAKGNPDQFDAVNNYHRSKFNSVSSKGFYVGYNYMISRNGTLRQAREDGEQNVAQYQNGYNDGRAISICLDGNFDIEEPTKEQKETVRKLLIEKMAKYNIPKENVICHRKVATYKSCPGKKLPEDIYSYFVPTDNLIPWAKDSVDWALKEGIITDPKINPIQQWMLVVLDRYNKKFNEPTNNNS